MSKCFYLLIFSSQKFLLRISYISFKVILSKKNKAKIVIGVIEIASFLTNLSRLIDNSYSVNLYSNKFYINDSDFEYSFEIKSKSFIKLVKRFFLGPIVLGYLLNISQTFIYLWDTGFLMNQDGRKFEFSYLKSKNKKIMCIFLGSEIRSPALMLEVYKNIETISTYSNVSENTDDYLKRERKIEVTAKVAERFSDVIFNDDYDQKSYFIRENKPIFYFIPKSKYPINLDKFHKIYSKKIIILHAPSNPYLKGTQVVRAAINSLKSKGYKIRYIELINRNHNDVLKHLSKAHIVVNELYSFTLGVFAIEAMSNYCAVLTSADIDVNKSLPKSNKIGWMRTRSWELHDNLGILFNDLTKLKEIADSGLKYVNKYFNDEMNSKLINEYISKFDFKS